MLWRMGCTTCQEKAPARRPARRRAAAATTPFAEPFPVPEYPPREWFDRPTWVAAWREANGLGPDVDENGIPKITVTDDGRVGGYFYEAGQCIIHMQDACPGPSPTRYAAFMQQDIVLDDGSILRVGVIGNTHGHASPWVDYQKAQAHYADPTAQMIVCRAGDDERGGWIAGAVIPGLTYGDVALIRRCGLSGDWRPMPDAWWRDHGITAAAVEEAEGYDCIGPTLVTRPALPLVKAFSETPGTRAAAILGGAAGVQLAAPRRPRRSRTVKPTTDQRWAARIAAAQTVKALVAAAPGNPEALREWYNDGADGAIDWGEPGSFMACVDIASNHMDEESAKGFCAERHHDATGEWPGAKKAATAAGDEPMDVRLRALAQELAIGQHQSGAKVGPMMSLLNSAAAYMKRGDTGAAMGKLADAVDLGKTMETEHPTLAGLADRIQAMIDEETGPQAATDWLAAIVRTAEWDESMHPRGEGGKFGEKEGDDKEKDDAKDGASLAERFANGEKGIELPVEQVATFTDRLAELTKNAQPGERYNLCEVSVPDTNLFCGDSQGIPRQEMPQFKGNAIDPEFEHAFGVDKNGEIDVTQGFLDKLKADGVKMTEERVPAAQLKASQNELRGEKVAGMTEAALAGKYDPTKEPIVVSRDNYVVDGHHRWAASVALDAQDGRLGDDVSMPVIRVDMPILDLLGEAKGYADQYVAPKAASVASLWPWATVAAIDQGVSMAKTTVELPDGTKIVSEATPAQASVDGRARRRGARVSAVVGAPDLNLADQAMEWDPAGAQQRVAAWASSDGSGLPETIDWQKYASGFFYANGDAAGPTFDAFLLPFADVVDGELQAVPAGLMAAAEAVAAGSLGVDIPAEDEQALKDRIGAYFTSMAEKFGDESIKVPWTAAGMGDEVEGPADEVEMGGGGEDEAAGLEERVAALEQRIAACEEMLGATMAAQVAAIVDSEPPLPSLT